MKKEFYICDRKVSKLEFIARLVSISPNNLSAHAYVTSYLNETSPICEHYSPGVHAMLEELVDNICYYKLPFKIVYTLYPISQTIESCKSFNKYVKPYRFS